ncbi:MAG: methyltransferase domain-containing protein, partial [Alphaproteobacteria bacterium]|nr:methyltransferase domain-containing protein [Alphaproteobacteria bacterium]
MSTLPTHILQALESLASAHQRTQLARAAEAVSSRYRRAQNDADTLQIRDEVEAAAYACARMPATYAAITRVLEAVGMTVPPRSMLDYGAGPGTATLAARALWPDVAAQMVEPNAAMRRVAKHLIGDADFRDTPTQADTVSPHRFRAIARSCGDTPDTDSHLMNENRYELVVAAYVLNEVGDPAALAEKLWGACGRILVLVDSGTPAAQAMMMQVRAQLLAAGAHLHAPCPHDLACPFAGPEGWCHFSTRLSRTRLHKALKGGALGY